jgi:hypothetical protein
MVTDPIPSRFHALNLELLKINVLSSKYCVKLQFPSDFGNINLPLYLSAYGYGSGSLLKVGSRSGPKKTGSAKACCNLASSRK